MESVPEKQSRLVSLDALRGANMFFIMGGASLFAALAALWPDSVFWKWVASQMDHVSWHGVAHHDMVFPTFLFIAGCAFPFSLAKQRERGRSTQQIVLKVLLRAFLLVLLGVLYNEGVKFNFSSLRYASVLGHIGLAWMFAALLKMAFGPKVRAGILVILLVGYWLALRSFTATDVSPDAGPYTMDGSLVGYIDRHFLPGRLYCGIHDPEGLFSIIPAVGTALLGVFAGEWLRKGGTETCRKQKTWGLIAAGLVLILIGWLWNIDFPINKNLWTSSFVCFVGGFSTLGLGIFYGIIDAAGWKAWAFPFVVIGMNSITIYFAQRLISFKSITGFFFQDAINRLPETWREPLSAACYVLVCWLFLFFLYKRKIFLKV